MSKSRSGPQHLLLAFCLIMMLATTADALREYVIPRYIFSSVIWLPVFVILQTIYDEIRLTRLIWQGAALKLEPVLTSLATAILFTPIAEGVVANRYALLVFNETYRTLWLVISWLPALIIGLQAGLIMGRTLGFTPLYSVCGITVTAAICRALYLFHAADPVTGGSGWALEIFASIVYAGLTLENTWKLAHIPQELLPTIRLSILKGVFMLIFTLYMLFVSSPFVTNREGAALPLVLVGTGMALSGLILFWRYKAAWLR